MSMATSIKGTSREDLATVIESVSAAMDDAIQYNLVAEVIATAMIYLKENPNASIDEALDAGLSDWDI